MDGGAASPVKGDARVSADQQGGQGTGDKKAVDAKSALAATQVQLRMARQLVLSEQDRASHAEVQLHNLFSNFRALYIELPIHSFRT